LGIYFSTRKPLKDTCMKPLTSFMICVFFIYCSTSPVKEEKSNSESETVGIIKEDTRQKYLSVYFASSRLNKNLTDKTAITKGKALSEEAKVLLKLKKNEEAIAKFEEAFEFATDPEAYYRYGSALSNLLKLEESIKAYDIAIELGYDKEYYAIYNKGCSYSILKNAEESFRNILLAVDKGYTAIPYMEQDPDLEYVRSLPEWKAKYKEIKKHAKQREEVEKSKG
jgi:tetratricopeptide (TPR) repeat protein